MQRLRSPMLLLAALLIHPYAAFADDPRIIAMPILGVELADNGDLNLSASVAGKGGQTVLAELTVLREANGSSARTRQSARIVLADDTPQIVSKVGLGGEPLDSLEARLTVTHAGRLIAETSTTLSPTSKE